MWFKVKQDFGTLKVGDAIELKSDSQYQTLIDAGKLEKTEAPQSEDSKDSIYTHGTVLKETFPIGEPIKEETQEPEIKQDSIIIDSPVIEEPEIISDEAIATEPTIEETKSETKASGKPGPKSKK